MATKKRPKRPEPLFEIGQWAVTRDSMFADYAYYGTVTKRRWSKEEQKWYYVITANNERRGWNLVKEEHMLHVRLIVTPEIEAWVKENS